MRFLTTLTAVTLLVGVSLSSPLAGREREPGPNDRSSMAGAARIAGSPGQAAATSVRQPPPMITSQTVRRAAPSAPTFQPTTPGVLTATPSSSFGMRHFSPSPGGSVNTAFRRPASNPLPTRTFQSVGGLPPNVVLNPNRSGPASASTALGQTPKIRVPALTSAVGPKPLVQTLTQGEVARKFKLAEQLTMQKEGDVARRLGLFKQAANFGNVAAASIPGSPPHKWSILNHYCGPVSASYVQACFGFPYCGPAYYPMYCWFPKWSPWVSWSWHCCYHPVWDPRPFWCQPVVYLPAPCWVWWDVPVWYPLPFVVCGTWVDVEPIFVGPAYDLQLLAVRFVDPGHPEEQLGPRYRVWFRNNSTRAIHRPFDVMLLASNDGLPASDLPQAGLRVTSIRAGDVQSIDIRLPVEVYSMGTSDQGQPTPFRKLHVLVDAAREVFETSEINNGAKLAPGEILPVDPAAFELNASAAAAGGEITVAGEGFGPEPGRVLVHLGGVELDAEILGWYDLGVRVALPNLPLAGAAKAKLVVIRGDGAAANPLEIAITPASHNPEPAPPAIP